MPTTPTHGGPTRRPETHEGDDPPPTRNVPPLVWVIAAILVIAVIFGVIQYGGTHVTPRGGETPMAKPAPATMPANR